MGMDMGDIRQCIKEGRWRLTLHVVRRCDERDLDVAEEPKWIDERTRRNV